MLEIGELIVGLLGSKTGQVVFIYPVSVLAGFAAESHLKPAREDQRIIDLPKPGVSLAGVYLLGQLRNNAFPDEL